MKRLVVRREHRKGPNWWGDTETLVNIPITFPRFTKRVDVANAALAQHGFTVVGDFWPLATMLGPSWPYAPISSDETQRTYAEIWGRH